MMEKFREKYINMTALIIWAMILVFMLFGIKIDFWREMLLFVVYGILTEALVISVQNSQLSMRFVIIVAAFMIFGGAGAVWICALFCLLGRGIFNRGNPWMQTVLYSAYNTIAVCSGFLAAYLVGGGAYTGITWKSMLQLLVFIVAYYFIYFFLSNNFLKEKQKHKTGNKSWANVLRLEALSFFITVPLGVLMYYTYSFIGTISTFFLFVPILAVQYLFSLALSLEKANRELGIVYKIAGKLSEQKELKQILPTILKDIKNVVPYQCAVIYLWSEKDEQIVPFVADSELNGYLDQISLKISDNDYLNDVLNSGQPDIVYDSQNDIRFQNRRGINNQCSSLLLMPWGVQGHSYGLIVLGHSRPYYYQGEHLSAMEVLVGEMAIVVTNYSLRNKLEIVDKFDFSGALKMEYFFHYSAIELNNNLTEGKEGAVLLINIKYLEEFRQRYHYLASEDLIRAIVGYTDHFIKQPKLIGHYAFGSIVVFLENTDEDTARRIAYNLRNGIALSIFNLTRYNIDARVSVDIGKAFYPEQANEVMELIWIAKEDVIKHKNI